MLAVGSHDNNIRIYSVKDNYKRIHTLGKHSAWITAVDWSTDSNYVRSNCGAYELLYHEVHKGIFLESGST